jgi:hypothetical protein
MSVPVTAATPETPTTVPETRVFLYALGVVRTATALPPASALATLGMLKIPKYLKVTDASHTVLEVA